jgi:hypothetical protein
MTYHYVNSFSESIANKTAVVSATQSALPSASAIPSVTPAVFAPLPRFATVAEAQREAIRRYPELGVPGSPFNSEFVALYKRYKRERPDVFQDNSWPLQLAQEIAGPGKPASSAAPVTTGSAK